MKQELVLGGGCFWCMEAFFQRIKGVTEVESGYSGGSLANPTYEQVCGGKTGHAEVVKITYDSEQISLKDLLSIFFNMHDPTTPNRQGNDVGEQYRSIIFYNNENEKQEIEKYLGYLGEQKVFDKPIVTELKPLEKFYPAEAYHKNYFLNNPDKAYCQLVINPKMHKLVDKYKSLIKE